MIYFSDDDDEKEKPTLDIIDYHNQEKKEYLYSFELLLSSDIRE